MRVFIACRNLRAGKQAAADIRQSVPAAKLELLDLDLGDFASVRQCAKDFLALKLPLHVLINNAGLAGAKGKTPSGFELAFGTNHLGHFLLTQLLLDNIRATAQMAGTARIVTVASRAHQRVQGIDFEAVQKSTQTATGFKEYGVSKLANVLFSMELARRLKGSGVSTYSLHPGVVATDVWRSVPWPIQPLIKRFMISVEEGAQTTIYCATAPAIATKSGLYWVDREMRNPSPVGRDLALAAELWSRSELWVKG
jgi:NAD(P)-dependent dehydrogenase (short-subunit alcohol dehydrogenase family)